MLLTARALPTRVNLLARLLASVVPASCALLSVGTGTLFGLAGDTGWGFEGKLEGGLDCRTGQFRATAPDGVYGFAGSTDPNDPDALWTVVDPPLGEFDGTLSGVHGGGPPEGIRGDWDLVDAAELARCTGPFMVELQP